MASAFGHLPCRKISPLAHPPFQTAAFANCNKVRHWPSNSHLEGTQLSPTLGKDWFHLTNLYITASKLLQPEKTVAGKETINVPEALEFHDYSALWNA
jgi:hypothetical protein